MSTQPSILLQGQPIQDPLAQYTRVVALKNALGQQQAQQQEAQQRDLQIQSGQMENQQKQLLFSDQQKISKVLADPSVAGDIGKAIPMLGPAGVSGQSILALSKGYDDHKDKLANISKAQAEADKANQEVETQQKSGIEDMLNGLGPNATAADLLSRGHLLAATSPSLAPKLQAILGPVLQAPDPDAAARQIVQQARGAKAQAAQAATAKTTAETAGLAAKLPGEEAASDQAVRANAAAKLGAAKSPAEYNSILGDLPMKVARQFVGKTPEQARTMGLNPEQQTQAVQAEVNEKDLKKYRDSELSLSRSKEGREQKIYDQTYGPGANPALVGVEPKLRVQASTQAQKAADEYVKAQAAERDMKTFLDLAKSGNKEAHAYLSPEGVLTLNTGRGVTRVNRQEIDAYAGAGSLFDNIAAKVGKLTSGQSIPPDVLKDIETLHGAIAGNSATTYNQKLGGINQNYRSNFKPIEAPPAPKSDTGGWKVIGVK